MGNGFSVDISSVVSGLEERKKNAEKAIKRTVSDMKTRAPGWVSKAVREEYSISAKDIKSSLSFEKGGTFSLGGVEVDNITLKYQGRVLTPTHFKMKPTSRPGKGKPYQVTAEIKKGQRKPLSSIAFLASAGGNGKQIPFKRTGAGRLPIESIKTVSVPQMIQSSEGTKPEIEKAINEGLQKRFEHYCDMYLGK